MLLDELAAQKKGDHQGNLDFIKAFSDLVSLWTAQESICRRQESISRKLLTEGIPKNGKPFGGFRTNSECYMKIPVGTLPYFSFVCLFVFSGLESKNKQNTDNIKTLQVCYFTPVLYPLSHLNTHSFSILFPCILLHLFSFSPRKKMIADSVTNTFNSFNF